MQRFPFNRNVIAVLHDALMAAASFYIAVYIRLGDERMDMATPYLLPGSILLTLISITIFIGMRQYRGLWRYASMRDMVAILKSVTLSMLVFAMAMILYNRLENVPRSVFFINWMLLLGMLAGPRFIYRALKDRTLHWRMSLQEGAKIPVVLVGATDMGERFIRDMARDPAALYEVVGILDDDPKRKDRTIHHIPIYGATDLLSTVVRKLERKARKPQKIIIADEQFTGGSLRHLLSRSDELGIPLARLPKASEVKTGIEEKPTIQPIALEDLLGRPQNVLDRDSMAKLVSGKPVLITGAGGTIGGELTRQIASYGPSKLILVELSEFNLYQIELEIREAYPALSLTAILADVRDKRYVDHIFAQHRPSLVFHAAAIKHVPLSEDNVEEAIVTNVLGTRHVAEAAMSAGSETMVMISTDKAVNPTNVMGATKRLAESICQALGAESQTTRFVTVRFGNVLGSTGSVVPLFTKQLAKGGPLTVTHPDVTRYFMTVREAVELVLQAAALGQTMQKQEYIFVLDMGQPVRILDLALQMIKLAGLRPQVDVQIRYTGLRPGEKLYEELFHFSENAVKTSHESIFLASPRSTDMASLRRELDRLFEACQARNSAKARQYLHELVPEFTRND
ncbi:MAG: nucleoside-diphosphate sugar epimerase/dehydratase [Rickettsiales bacterium]|nr:nucleoside-diphosphate sugar epimerase/dehydratase [Rickettsiales bacterium]